ncbi:VanZ family protein [Catenuloplanes sp. NPDC051500]|uniref:VanZ family protein n=1 Tax=Catenuloplanes sp. NPDC051500 TaxID=3363959 RepID=UPI00378ED916
MLLPPSFVVLFVGYAAALLVLLVLLLAIARARGLDRWWAAGTAVSLAVILALTAPVGALVDDWAGAADAFAHRFTDPGVLVQALADVHLNAERQANVLLFIPAGLAGALLTRSFVPVAVALSGLSWLIELIQSMSTTRYGAAEDWVYNTTGALIGVMVAALWRLATRSREETPAEDTTIRLPAVPARGAR